MGKKIITNKDGVAFISMIQSFSPTEIKLQNSSLNDFYWASTKPIVKIKTLHGAITTIHFPISIVGEIEGYIKIFDGKEEKIAEGVIIELVNTKEK